MSNEGTGGSADGSVGSDASGGGGQTAGERPGGGDPHWTIESNPPDLTKGDSGKLRD